MFISKKSLYFCFAVFACAGILVGATLSGSFGKLARAENTCALDESTLEKIYTSVFHRSLDANAYGYVGENLDTVLDALDSSEEHIQYTGLFKAMKAYEEAKRTGQQMTEEEKGQYEDIIDSALSTVSAWADTLPEQAEEDAVVGPEQAREAIQTAYNNMNGVAQAAAEYGLFQAQEQIGSPGNLSLPDFTPGNAKSE